MERDVLSSLIRYKVLRRRRTDLENVRFETEDEEEAAQFAHPVRDEIVRGVYRGYCYCCLRVCLFDLVKGKNRNGSGLRGKKAGSTRKRE